MKKIVLGISLLCSGWVFSQSATAWSHLEKKGEYRRNPTTGNIEYYEYNTPSRRNSYAEELARSQRETANSVRMLGEALAVRAQLDAQREREEYEYYSNLYEKSNRLRSEANKAFNDKKYATARNKYVEAYNVIVNIPRRYNVEGDKAYLYASWLESMYYNKEYARFLEKYNYDKIKYSTDKELNKKLGGFYKDITGDSIREEALNFYNNGNYTRAIQKYKEAYTYQRDKLKGILNENRRLQKMADNYMGYLWSLVKVNNYDKFFHEYNYNIIKYSLNNSGKIYIEQAYDNLVVAKKVEESESYINTKNYVNAEKTLWEIYLYYKGLNDIKGKKEKKKFLFFDLTDNQIVASIRDDMSRSYIGYLQMLLVQNKTALFLEMYDKNKIKYTTDAKMLEEIRKQYKAVKQQNKK